MGAIVGLAQKAAKKIADLIVKQVLNYLKSEKFKKHLKFAIEALVVKMVDKVLSEKNNATVNQ
ncbi:hypothetical protein HPA16_01000 [Streptococcus suis]|nr:hypothetical protein [Streptococcus suis]